MILTHLSKFFPERITSNMIQKDATDEYVLGTQSTIASLKIHTDPGDDLEEVGYNRLHSNYDKTHFVRWGKEKQHMNCQAVDNVTYIHCSSYHTMRLLFATPQKTGPV